MSIEFLRRRPLRLPMRMALRITAMRNPQHAATIQQALDNDEVMALLEDHFQQRLEQQGKEQLLLVEPTAAKPQHPVLEWLLAHKEEIMSFLLMALKIGVALAVTAPPSQQLPQASKQA